MLRLVLWQPTFSEQLFSTRLPLSTARRHRKLLIQSPDGSVLAQLKMMSSKIFLYTILLLTSISNSIGYRFNCLHFNESSCQCDTEEELIDCNSLGLTVFPTLKTRLRGYTVWTLAFNNISGPLPNERQLIKHLPDLQVCYNYLIWSRHRLISWFDEEISTGKWSIMQWSAIDYRYPTDQWVIDHWQTISLTINTWSITWSIDNHMIILLANRFTRQSAIGLRRNPRKIRSNQRSFSLHGRRNATIPYPPNPPNNCRSNRSAAMHQFLVSPGTRCQSSLVEDVRPFEPRLAKSETKVGAVEREDVRKFETEG